MHTLKMEKLGRLMDRTADQGLPFDLECWAYAVDGPLPGGERLRRMIATGEGMSGCAAGRACMSPEFAGEGFSLAVITVSRRSLCGCAACAQSAESRDVGLIPAFEGFHGYEAAARFFELDMHSTAFLFSPSGYPEQGGKPPARLVAERVRLLLATGSVYAADSKGALATEGARVPTSPLLVAEAAAGPMDAERAGLDLRLPLQPASPAEIAERLRLSVRESLARLWDGGGGALRQEAVHRMRGATPGPAAPAERAREPVPA